MTYDSLLSVAKARWQALSTSLAPSPAARRILSFGFSVAILFYLAHAVADIGWREVLAVLPANPLFYVLMAMSYMATPVTEYIIFRRWWPLTPRAIAVHVKKQVMNEAILGYSGDAYLFVWARRNLGMRDLGVGPLAGVKDVAITSALAGNLGTLIFLALALSLGGGSAVEDAFSGTAMHSVGIGFIVVIAISMGILLFSRKLMSLSMRENATIFALHSVRMLLSSALPIFAWMIALPEVDARTWIVLGALRLVVSRLPFLPNKELLFAAIGVSMTGAVAPQVAALMAASGTLFLAFHVLSYAGSSFIESRGDVVKAHVLPAEPAAGSA